VGTGVSVLGSGAGSGNDTGSCIGTGDVSNAGSVIGSGSSESGSSTNICVGAAGCEAGEAAERMARVMAAWTSPGGGRRGARHSLHSPLAVPAQFAVFSFFSLVVRRYQEMTEEVVFGSVIIQQGAAMIGGCTRAGQSGTAVAALPRLRQRRWWRRCFLAVAVITAGVG
jgi:hypothetical protein